MKELNKRFTIIFVSSFTVTITVPNQLALFDVSQCTYTVAFWWTKTNLIWHLRVFFKNSTIE